MTFEQIELAPVTTLLLEHEGQRQGGALERVRDKEKQTSKVERMSEMGLLVVYQA